MLDTGVTGILHAWPGLATVITMLHHAEGTF